ncbi:MAG: hypothetical protein R2873_09210 [Caldilineaceae bacterium]
MIFAPLAEADGAEGLLSALFHALGLVGEQQQEPVQQICNHLSRRRAILVLDNLEQLLVEPQAPGIVAILLRMLVGAPHVKLLITSREPLHVRGEYLIALDGLTQPGADADPQTSDAFLLFVQAARHYLPAFTPNPAEAQEIARIASLVFGMPLALEMAAAWLRLMPCSAVAAEIERNVDFLEAPLRDLPRRHRRLRAVFESSWQLLTADERAALARLSIFAGTFDLVAVRRVADVGPRLLASLVDNSLVLRVGEGRYLLHDLLKRFAAEKLTHLATDDTGLGEADLRRRHCHHYLGLLGDQDNAHTLSASTLVAVDAALDNVRQAWRAAVDAADAAICASALSPLSLFFQWTGRFGEGLDSFASAAERWAGPTLLRGRLLLEAGRCAERAGFYRTALMHCERALPDLSADPLFTAQGLCELGIVHWRLNEPEAARSALQNSLNAAEAVGDPHTLGYIGHHLANLSITDGEPTRALPLYHDAHRHYAAAGDRYLEAGLLSDWGLAHYLSGDTDAARQQMLESSRRYAALGAWAAQLLPLTNLATICVELDEWTSAQRYLEEVVDLAERVGHGYRHTIALGMMGHLCCLRGDLTQARGHLYAALANLRAYEDDDLETVILNALAHLCFAQGEINLAVRLSATVAGLRGASLLYDQFESSVHERIVREAKHGLSSGEFDAAWSAGAQLRTEYWVAWFLS